MTTFGFGLNSTQCPARHPSAAGDGAAGGTGTLAQAVQAAARRLDDRKLIPVARHSQGLASHPKALLALISYSYARQIYSSAQVQAQLQHDLNARGIYGSEVPDADTIRTFCRENHDALQFCLLAGLRFLAEQKVAQGTVTKVCETQLADEASRRITMAMFTDTMELKPQPNEDFTV